MPTTRASVPCAPSRTSSTRMARVVCVVLVLALALAITSMGPGGHGRSPRAVAALDTAPSADTTAAAPVEDLMSRAVALAPAERVNLDGTIPIFPMQTTPRCDILDNFGDARSGGRSHEGTDILATLGQEVYA